MKNNLSKQFWQYCWGIVLLLTAWSTQVSAQCDIIYVSTTGSSLADGSEATPVDLQTALNQACSQNRLHIRLLSGTYNLNSKMIIGCDGVIIDGDWEVVSGIGRKNSNLTTTININSPLETASFDGGGGTTVGFYKGIEAIGQDNFLIQDITFNVKNGGSSGSATGTTGNRGNSIYGFYFRNATGWHIERCTMNTGQASRGTNGTSRPKAANGGAGSNGSSAQCNNDCTTNFGGRGGNGAGGGGAGAPQRNHGACHSTGVTGANGTASTGSTRRGGGGGAGGTGGQEDRRGGRGGAGAAGGGGGGGSTGAASTGSNGGTGGGNCSSVNAGSAGNGGAGSNGVNAVTPAISSTFDFYWLPNPQSPSGTDATGGGGGGAGGGGGGQGCFFCTDGSGGGGGGGGGGEGGQAGTGGWGSGSSFALYVNASTGSRNNVNLVTAGVAIGGTKGNGGQGGDGGVRGGRNGTNGGLLGCSTCEVGLGGFGGNGGNGGRGGDGANGANGRSEAQRTVSGGSVSTTTSPAIPNIITNQPLEGCANSEILITKNSGTWGFPAGAGLINDLDATTSSYINSSSTAIATYNNVGSQDILINGINYGGFIQINTPRPLPVFASSMPTIICEGDVFPMSTTTFGNSYEWIIFESSMNSGSPVAIFTNSVAGWNTPITGTTRNYTAKLRIRTECCGWSAPVYFDFTVAGTSTPPTAMGDVVCTGQTATLTATGSGSGNIDWYADPLGQILLQSTPGVNSSYTTTPLNQSTVFYVGESVSGCVGTLTSVIATVITAPNPPSTNNVVVCDGDDVLLTATGSGSGDLVYYNSSNVEIGRITMGPAFSGTFNAGPLPIGNYAFYVAEDNGTCTSLPNTIGVVVNGLPVAPTITGTTTICANSNTTLNVTSSGIVNWYSDATLTTLVFSGSGFTTPTLTGNTSFWATQTINNCESPATQVDIIVNPNPANPTVAPVTICAGETATLTATNGGGTTNWYSDPSGTNLLASGTSFTTGILTQSTSFYTQEESGAGCTSALVTAVVTVNSLPNSPSANTTTVCDGEDVILSASGSGSGDLVFYNSANTEVGRITMSIANPTATFNAGALAAGTYTFFVREDDGNCLSGSRTIVATVNPLPTAPVITGTMTVCQNQNTTLSTSVAGLAYWYSDMTLTTLVHSGNVYTTPNLSTVGTTSYWVTQKDGNGCESASTQVDVTVNTNPTTPTPSPDTICTGDTAILAATTSGGALEWYSDPTGGNLIGTGTPFITSPLYQNTSFYVREVAASSCVSSLASVTAIVNALPNTPGTSPVVVCDGDDVILSATGSGTGDLVFYDNTQTEIARFTMGTTSTTGTHNLGALAAGTYNYFVREDNGDCVSPLVTIGVTVNANPVAPTITGTTMLCENQNTTLTVSSAGMVNWYADAAMTNLLFTGTAYATPSFATAGVTSYWATVINANGCESAASQVDVTVNANPAAPTTTPDTVCAGETATLMATGSGVSLEWFDNSVSFYTSASPSTYMVPNLTQNVTYYVNQTDANGCISPMAPVSAIVNPLPNAPSAGSVTVCDGDDVILSASGSGSGDLVFYDNTNTEITRIAMTSTTPTAMHNVGALAAGTYTFFVNEDNGDCVSALVTISVTVNAVAAAPTVAGNTTVCIGENTVLTATATGVVNWYADAAMTNLVFTGSTYTTPTLNTAGTTSYWVTQTANGCESLAGQVDVTVNINPATPTVGAVTICAGETATLTVSGGAGLFTWYSDATGSTLLGTGTTFTTPILNQSTIVYVRETNATGCQSDLAAGLINVNQLPNSPNANNPTVCDGDDVILTATGSGTGDLVFYDNTNTEVGRTTMSATTPSATFNAGALAAGAYTFYVNEDDGNCESPLVTTAVTVNALPTAPTAAGATICAGNTATLSTTSTGTVKWYADAAMTNLITTGNSLTTAVLTANASYWLTTTNANGCESMATQVDVVVNPMPAQLAVTNDTICAGSSTTLTVTGAGGTIEWYSDATASTLLATGNTLNLQVVSQSTVYYVREVSAAGCNGNLASVMVIVNTLPLAPSVSDFEICSGSPVTIFAMGSGTGDLVFYDLSNTEVFRGTMSTGNTTINYNAGVLAVGTYGFYVIEEQGDCQSTRSNIVVTVKTLPAAPTATNDGPVCEGDDVVLQASTVSGATYNWGGPNGFSSTLQTNLISAVSSANAGLYTVNVTLDGCVSANSTTTVAVNTIPVISGAIVTNSPLCEGDELDVNAPTVANASYEWTGPNGFMATTEDFSIPNVREVDEQGFYLLTATDSTTACQSLPVATLVKINRLPEPGVLFSNSPVCAGGTIELYVPEIFGATYSWTGPDGFSSTDRVITVANADLNKAGTYSVEVAIDACVTTMTTKVEISTNNNITIIPDTTIIEGSTLNLYATGGVLYQWTPGTYLSDVNSATPLFAGAPVGVYDYNLDITDAKGCTVANSFKVTVVPQNVLKIVDLFTPNGDGINDTWEVDYLYNAEPYTMQVFSRGGMEVLNTNNYQNNWDGTFKGKALPDGTYWYIIRTQDTEYRGAVTIKR